MDIYIFEDRNNSENVMWVDCYRGTNDKTIKDLVEKGKKFANDNVKRVFNTDKVYFRILLNGNERIKSGKIYC